jgi:uncharacterized protein
MKINLKQLFDIVGEEKKLHYSIPLNELSDINGYEFASPVIIDGSIFNRAGIVNMNFSTEFSLKIICDRCLKSLDREFHFEFDHIIVKALNTDNDDYIIADGESIDVNEIAISDLLLQLPSKMLCSEECRGLCCVCGADLNDSECSCLKQ